MKEKFHITIGRQIGSGGHQIGEELARDLGIAFYDRELIEIAAQQSGLGKEPFENIEEKKAYSLLTSFPWLGGNTEEFVMNNYLGNENVFKIQSDVIRDLANRDSAVFVGRCADYALSEFPRCISIFISANMNDRIHRITERRGLTENKAVDYIEKIDKRRAAYYNFYSNKAWGEASSYHLCINSSVFGIEMTVKLIRDFTERYLLNG